MKRFIGAEIVRTMFPYAGNGTLIFDRILMIAFLFSCVRLMLIIHADDEGNCPDDETITRIFQTCVRHTAHLSKDLVQYLRDRKMNNIQRLEEAVRIFETAEK